MTLSYIKNCRKNSLSIPVNILLFVLLALFFISCGNNAKAPPETSGFRLKESFLKGHNTAGLSVEMTKKYHYKLGRLVQEDLCAKIGNGDTFCSIYATHDYDDKNRIIQSEIWNKDNSKDTRKKTATTIYQYQGDSHQIIKTDHLSASTPGQTYFYQYDDTGDIQKILASDNKTTIVSLVYKDGLIVEQKSWDKTKSYVEKKYSYENNRLNQTKGYLTQENSLDGKVDSTTDYLHDSQGRVKEQIWSSVGQEPIKWLYTYENQTCLSFIQDGGSSYTTVIEQIILNSRFCKK